MLRNLCKVVCWKHTAARRAAPRDHPLLSFSLFLLLLLALERKVWGSWQLTCVWLLYLSNLLVFLKKSLHIFKPQSLTNATFEAEAHLVASVFMSAWGQRTGWSVSSGYASSEWFSIQKWVSFSIWMSNFKENRRNCKWKNRSNFLPWRNKSRNLCCVWLVHLLWLKLSKECVCKIREFHLRVKMDIYLYVNR